MALIPNIREVTERTVRWMRRPLIQRHPGAVAFVDSTMQNREILAVSWSMTSVCNYKCSYCPDYLHDGRSKFPDPEAAFRTVDRLHDVAERKGWGLWLDLSGGEASLWPHFEAFVNYARSKSARIGLNSNGSRPLDFWKRVGPTLASLHLSFHTEYGDPDAFCRVVELMGAMPEMQLGVSVMALPERFDLAEAVIERVAALSCCSLVLEPLFHDLGFNGERLASYSPRQERLLAHTGGVPNKIRTPRHQFTQILKNGERVEMSSHRMRAEGRNGWRGWRCHAGRENLCIDAYGTVYRGWCQEGGRVGSIADPDLDLDLEPIICDKSYCHCLFDMAATKTRIGKSHESLRILDEA
jgi:MoaA/NifB/PqqE/SkfB family radical SAM enzyme